MTARRQAPGAPASHQALFYESAEDYVGGILPFLHDGLVAGEPALVAVPGPRVDLLRASLGGPPGEVSFADMADVGRNPARILPAIRRFTDSHPGRRTRFVGEPVWPGRPAAEAREATRSEALLNTAFAGTTTTTILCPYDTAGLDEAVIAGAMSTHPHVVDRGGCRPSPGYRDPAAALPADDQLLPGPPGDAEMLAFRGGELGRVRGVVEDHARRAGLGPERVQDLVVAVNEVATNTVVHTGAPGSLRMWSHPGGVVCEVSDDGHIADPLVGRVMPSARADGRRGLWLVNQVCDLVELRSGPSGTTIRLHVLHR
ncbi:MAG: anti-sigma factor RsbA family regulatory protein [Acidimicrobiales bacterium]